MRHRPDISVLFVCRDNASRSPVAHAIATAVAADRGLDRVRIDSAGIRTVLRGADPEPVCVVEAGRRGYRLDHRTRPVHPDDFAEFDLIVVMDRAEMDDVRRLGGAVDQRIGPYDALEPQQLQLLRRWDPYGMPGDEDVIDPEGLGRDAYAEMFDVLERSIPPLLDHLVWLTEDIAKQA